MNVPITMGDVNTTVSIPWVRLGAPAMTAITGHFEASVMVRS